MRDLTCRGARLGAVLMVLSGPAGSSPTPEVGPRDAYRAEIEAWREKRFARLKAEDGWLSLAGLFWLQEGANRFGSDPAGRIVLPAGKAPANLGSIELHAGKATVTVAPGVVVTEAGRGVASKRLVSDADGDPTVLEHGSLRFYLIRRGERLGVRVKDRDSAARRDFHGIDHYEVDPRWRLDARFEKYDPPRTIAVPNVLGTISQEPSPGAVVFQIGDKTYRLDAVTESDTNELFLIFGDRSNGLETYGGGRFLYAPEPADGRTVVDFNKAYNPPCVFSPYATCPLPPPQNKLAVKIEAGEKRYEH